MLKGKRIKIYLEYLNKFQDASIIDFLKLIDVSESTIRRDIKYLLNSDLIQEMHGNFSLVNNNQQDTLFDTRMVENVDIKKQIALKAANFIEDNDNIFIDSGSTTFFMLKFIKAKNIRVITNNLQIALEGLKYSLEIFLVGGQLKKNTLASVGEIALETLDRFWFDKSFIGTNGINISHGFSTPEIKEGSFKKAVIKKSSKNYILATSDKFDKNSMISFADINSATIITDKSPKEDNDKYKIILSNN